MFVSHELLHNNSGIMNCVDSWGVTADRSRDIVQESQPTMNLGRPVQPSMELTSQVSTYSQYQRPVSYASNNANNVHYQAPYYVPLLSDQYRWISPQTRTDNLVAMSSGFENIGTLPSHANSSFDTNTRRSPSTFDIINQGTSSSNYQTTRQHRCTSANRPRISSSQSEREARSRAQHESSRGLPNQRLAGSFSVEAPPQPTMHDILLSYQDYRDSLPQGSPSIKSFMRQHHERSCNGGKCNCTNVVTIVCHYADCKRTDCQNKCASVRGMSRSRGAVLKRDLCHSMTAEEIQPAQKRMKAETAASSVRDSCGNDGFQQSQNVCSERMDSVSTRPRDSFQVLIELDSPVRGTASSVDDQKISEDHKDGEDDKGLWAELFDTEACDDSQSQQRNSNSPCLNTDIISALSEECLNAEAQNGNTEVAEEKNNVEDEDPVELMHEAENISNGAEDAKGTACEGSEYANVLLEEDTPMKPGVALTDFFSAEEIRQNLVSLNPSLNLDLYASNGKHSVGENTCQLCLKEELFFAAPHVNCISCGHKIKQRSYHWTEDEGGKIYSYCNPCVRKYDLMLTSGRRISKQELKRAEMIEEEEQWVQCDKCQSWQHQICALYNPHLNNGEDVKYKCPFCRLQDMESTTYERKVKHQITEARDLDRTKLSDHIEERLLRSLQQEREERAKALGKSPAEVPGAEDLTVRVVVSEDKMLKVKQHFLNSLPEETYPEQFPYKSKVILLFQKLDGADVCIFAMYVQEFGSDCPNPNRRSINIAYLDSVKYFRPDVVTVSGVPLRTFVYYELLIGYIDYCKRRGFATCYIWACPSSKENDYIMYCHPQFQRKLKKSMLVDWYKMMIQRAVDEKVVVDYTNFYEKFFVRREKSSPKITAARLPYFDESYWDLAIQNICHKTEKNSAVTSQRKVSKKCAKDMGHSDLSEKIAKDILLMQELGRGVRSDKEGLLVIHLQHICVKCDKPVLSGKCWSCRECKNYHLCRRCGVTEKRIKERIIHTIHGKTHQLNEIQVDGREDDDTDDKDFTIRSDILEDRCSFLEFCQTNNYQFDTLRRAKHSSMMILYGHQLLQKQGNGSV